MQANALHVAYHYIPGTYMYSWLLLIYSTTFTLLQGLTQVEKMLISAIMPIMSIYRLPHGQYGYSGHVINLPQDVSSFATSLPRLSSELDVIVVRKEGANQSHRDFCVRRSVIYQALHWLVTNNIYYRANQITINHDTLAQLPQDGNLSNVSTVTMPCPSLSEEGIRPEQVTNRSMITSPSPLFQRPLDQ